MILYIHSRCLPLSTFVVHVEASWTVGRVRGAILHDLAEIGHHRHPFRYENSLKVELAKIKKKPQVGGSNYVEIQLVFL